MRFLWRKTSVYQVTLLIYWLLTLCRKNICEWVPFRVWFLQKPFYKKWCTFLRNAPIALLKHQQIPANKSNTTPVKLNHLSPGITSLIWKQITYHFNWLIHVFPVLRSRLRLGWPLRFRRHFLLRFFCTFFWEKQKETEKGKVNLGQNVTYEYVPWMEILRTS